MNDQQFAQLMLELKRLRTGVLIAAGIMGVALLAELLRFHF